jgi:hypothetical protein
MFNLIACILSLTVANFLYQQFFASVPNFDSAMFETFDQAVGIIIYHFCFVRFSKDA